MQGEEDKTLEPNFVPTKSETYKDILISSFDNMKERSLVLHLDLI